jgi:hypothetical protein
MIDWNEAPEGAERFNDDFGGFMRKLNGKVQYFCGIWQSFSNQAAASTDWDDATPRPEEKPVTPKKSGSKYIITICNKRGESIEVDAYDIIAACNITCPAHAHAVKKVLYTGLRGHKDRSTDLRESIDALERAIELASNS